jgi:hypothetical protein
VSAAFPPPGERRVGGAVLKLGLAVLAVIVLAGGAYGAVKWATTRDDQDPVAAGSGTPSASTGGTAGGTANRPAEETPAPVRRNSITVAVLNGTGVAGLAARELEQVERLGYTTGAKDNAGVSRSASIVLYPSGKRRSAQLVAKDLKISDVQPIDGATASRAGDADVVVIVGEDQATS